MEFQFNLPVIINILVGIVVGMGIMILICKRSKGKIKAPIRGATPVTPDVEPENNEEPRVLPIPPASPEREGDNDNEVEAYKAMAGIFATLFPNLPRPDTIDEIGSVISTQLQTGKANTATLERLCNLLGVEAQAADADTLYAIYENLRQDNALPNDNAQSDAEDDETRRTLSNLLDKFEEKLKDQGLRKDNNPVEKARNDVKDKGNPIEILRKLFQLLPSALKEKRADNNVPARTVSNGKTCTIKYELGSFSRNGDTTVLSDYLKSKLKDLNIPVNESLGSVDAILEDVVKKQQSNKPKSEEQEESKAEATTEPAAEKPDNNPVAEPAHVAVDTAAPAPEAEAPAQPGNAEAITAEAKESPEPAYAEASEKLINLIHKKNKEASTEGKSVSELLTIYADLCAKSENNLIKELSEKEDTIKNQNKEINIRTKELEKIAKEKEDKENAAKSKIDSLLADKDRLNAEVDSLKRKESELGNEVTQLKTQVEGLNTDVDNLNKGVDSLQSALTAETLNLKQTLVSGVDKIRGAWRPFLKACSEEYEENCETNEESLKNALEETLDQVAEIAPADTLKPEEYLAKIQQALIRQLNTEDSAFVLICRYYAYSLLPFMTDTSRDAGIAISRPAITAMYDALCDLYTSFGIRIILPPLFMARLEEGAATDLTGNKYPELDNYCPNPKNHLPAGAYEDVIVDLVFPGYANTRTGDSADSGRLPGVLI